MEESGTAGGRAGGDDEEPRMAAARGNLREITPEPGPGRSGQVWEAQGAAGHKGSRERKNQGGRDCIGGRRLGVKHEIMGKEGEMCDGIGIMSAKG